MSVRRKIMIWVAGAGFLTSLVLSLVVFMEMKEQPYDILDHDLEAEAGAVAAQLMATAFPDAETGRPLILVSRYWVRVLDGNLKPVLWSVLSEKADLPLYDEKNEGYTVDARITGGAPSSGRDADGDAPFRVRVVPVQIRGAGYLIQVAKPISKLEDEISDLMVALFTGLVVSFILLCLFSYYVAGKIVEPIAVINRLTREINEKTLERRIPLGKSHDEIFKLSESLNRMFDRLQFSFRRQKELLANASHELKSPTAMLRLFFEEAGRREDLPEDFRRQLLQQGKNALRMERLAKTLLELSALELASSVEKEDFPFSGLIRDVLEDFSAVFRAENLKVELDAPEDLELCGDRGKIRRLLINLLDNAVKYNCENGEIRVEAGNVKGEVRLSVFNTGPGVPIEELEKVFDQFHRVEKSRSVQYGGAGLGLSIARQIVNLHGGRIWMESAPGRFARVCVSFPFFAEE